jgi:P4 family phage/plasmid primase-like protien
MPSISNPDVAGKLILEFLSTFFPPTVEGWLTIFSTPGETTRFFRCDRLDDATAYVLRQAETHNTYFGVGLRRERLTQGRGDAASIVALPSLFADIDIRHNEAHKKVNLPPTINDALQLIHEAFPDQPPSLTVSSGHGIQPHWLFDTLWGLPDAEARAEVERVLKGFGSHLQATARARGWTIDSVFDLARVLRIPATLNHKVPGDIVPVTLHEFHPHRRYPREAFARYALPFTPTIEETPSIEVNEHELAPSTVHQPGISTWAKYVIQLGQDPHHPERYHDRSALLADVVKALIQAGLDDIAIAAILLNPAYSVSEKPREKGLAWTLKMIGPIRDWMRSSARPTPANPISADAENPSPEEPSDNEGADEASGSSAGSSTPPPEDEPQPTEKLARGFHLTDHGNAQRLTYRYGRDLHYIDTWAKWLLWNGYHWELDQVRTIEALAKRVIGELFRWASRQIRAMGTEVAEGTEDEQKAHNEQLKRLMDVLKWALTSESASRIKAMVELAKSEPSIPVIPERLDSNPWILNCANGVLDLRTGKLQPHRREDLLMKMCPIHYDPHADCPKWRAFLHDIMDGKQALIDYLQRAIGYSLTGSVEEQCLFFLFGRGQNGKSTLLSIILALLADYAMQTIPELLMVRHHEHHPTERADLFGKRFVATIEVEAGKRMAESLVKQLTGADRIRARRMREDFWEFDPSHKIWLASNHLPVIRGRDYAIWRRIRLVPFVVTIDDEKKDPKLLEKLKGELVGILAWSVKGCLEWQRSGLAEPAEITQATQDYKAEMDVVGQFLKDCCLIKPGRSDIKTNTTALHNAFLRWSGDSTMTLKAFGDALQELGYTKKMGGDGRLYWLGIGLIVQAEDDRR